MGITFEVRRADLNELSQLAMLFDKYRQFYKQTPNLEGARAFIEDRIKANESAIFIVMDSSGRSVGFTQLFPMFSSVRMRSIWVLNDLFVLEEARKMGVAQKLIKAAEVWGQSQGAVGLELATARDNKTAKSVYDAMGWKIELEFDHYSITL
jgi:GNAT superfamily N-acetyltransferase